MAVTDIVSGALPEDAHRSQLRRAIIASTIGTTIEWYDFLLYGIVTGLVFGKLFFPKSDPLVGVLEAFSIYCGGLHRAPVRRSDFRSFRRSHRPQGGADHDLADHRLRHVRGRAVVPTYDSIGIWGAVILTAIRFIQGIGVGGEWGGSVLLSMEWARTNIIAASSPRGRSSACPGRVAARHIRRCCFSVGLPATSSWSGAGVYRFCSASSWRPSGFTSGSASSKRRSSSDCVAEKRIERAPVLEVIRRQPKEIILCALAKTAETAPAYIYIWRSSLSTARKCCMQSREFLLSALIAACGLLSFFVIPLSGHLSDRIGRKRMYLIGAVATGMFGFVYFAMLNSLVPALMFLAVMLSFVPHGMIFGPQAALFAECFTPRLRYSGTSIGFHLAVDYRRRAGAADCHRAAGLAGTGIGLRHRRLHRGRPRSSASRRRCCCPITPTRTSRRSTCEAVSVATRSGYITDIAV